MTDLAFSRLLPRGIFPDLAIALVALLIGTAASAHTAALTVQVTDSAGQPVADSAIYAEPVSGPIPARQMKPVEIEQRARKFLPPVTVIQVGTQVSFPNNDTVRHHVYSFSPAKTFEIKLYTGEPTNPVLFDKAGTVAIGCNIHDQMTAYIHVVPTPYFAKTGVDGKARLEQLPAGRYRLKAWHFGLPAGAALPEQQINVGSGDSVAAFALNMKARPAN